MSAGWVLVARHSQASRINGVQMWRLTFYCLRSGELWEMTVDSSYRNFHRQGWDHVVSAASPWGVYQGLRRTRRRTREGMPVLTADGAAELIWRAQDLDQALQLVQVRERELHPDPRELFF